jgi:8-oxo-dGTP pyrophosphatase MutT (NUDIX family)
LPLLPQALSARRDALCVVCSAEAPDSRARADGGLGRGRHRRLSQLVHAMTMLVRPAEMEKHPDGRFGTPLQQYGALPWRRRRNGELEVMLITARQSGRWILPRGWPVTGKTPAQTATQEAFEEAGVVGGVDPRPIGEYRYLKILPDGSSNDCLVTLFSLRVSGTLVQWREQAERKRRWHGLSQASQIASDRQLAELLATLHRDHKTAM